MALLDGTYLELDLSENLTKLETGNGNRKSASEKA